MRREIGHGIFHEALEINQAIEISKSIINEEKAARKSSASKIIEKHEGESERRNNQHRRNGENRRNEKSKKKEKRKAEIINQCGVSKWKKEKKSTKFTKPHEEGKPRYSAYLKPTAATSKSIEEIKLELNTHRYSKIVIISYIIQKSYKWRKIEETIYKSATASELATSHRPARKYQPHHLTTHMPKWRNDEENLRHRKWNETRKYFAMAPHHNPRINLHAKSKMKIRK